ncbi:hypothetical protein [Collimonas pratensis]|uniref:Phage integrase family protein n=1 Tax=Collimonas pratensis TaxID=279113 RepID=A0A127Q815_9BURK|nr:hypothetical protein [Collimonas pratensis]AMP06136.1 hypothetical protein CPter91_3815 [Collimonas pratensis]
MTDPMQKISLIHQTARVVDLDHHLDREWFLLDSEWPDVLWRFKPTNVLEESRLVIIRWDFGLQNGLNFTDDQYAALLETSRQLIALIRNCSLSTGLAQRASTTVGYFLYLRELIRWMLSAGYASFGQLNAQALLEFQYYISQRKGVKRATLAPATIQKYLYLLIYLFRFRTQLNDGLCFDPFPGVSLGTVAGVRDRNIRRWPYTPDAIAVPLIQRSIGLVEDGCSMILQARDIYADAIAAAMARGFYAKACDDAATRALRRAAISIPGTSTTILSISELAQLVDMLYAACFIVISYLVGPRLSEILHLEAGCVRLQGEGKTAVTVIVGTIFKRQPEYHGRPHEWVAPPAAVQAVRVLEALSENHRRHAQRPQLWLRRSHARGASEWQVPCRGTLTITSNERLHNSLNRLALWLDLPTHDNKPWMLSAYQGRKTFARYAALRDRSALFALAQHLGHRERSATDIGYSGSDYRLNAEIDAEILEQSTGAWEHMLTSSGLAGRAGAEILSKRPRFRGARMKLEIRAYARMLVDVGLTLGVCDWGFCIYREHSSACLGNAAGPNTERREPSTCANCANFAVSNKHRPYWTGQLDRCNDMLNEISLPLQTLRIVRERIQEAQLIIQKLDQNPEESGNG